MSNLSSFVKRIRDVMRNDAGINGDAQRIEQIAWMLFLKVYDGKDGFLVEPNNVSDFAKRMVELANNEMLRKQFGAYGKEDVKRLSPESVFKMWDKLFGEV